MSRVQTVQHWVGFVILLAALLYFWTRWLRPGHDIDTFTYVINVIVVGWQTLLPLYFILILTGARVPSSNIPLPPGYRVAMVVTKVPSEPFPLVRETYLHLGAFTAINVGPVVVGLSGGWAHDQQLRSGYYGTAGFYVPF
jgi:hypothetical protein